MLPWLTRLDWLSSFFSVTKPESSCVVVIVVPLDCARLLDWVVREVMLWRMLKDGVSEWQIKRAVMLLWCAYDAEVQSQKQLFSLVHLGVSDQTNEGQADLYHVKDIVRSCLIKKCCTPSWTCGCLFINRFSLLKTGSNVAARSTIIFSWQAAETEHCHLRLTNFWIPPFCQSCPSCPLTRVEVCCPCPVVIVIMPNDKTLVLPAASASRPVCGCCSSWSLRRSCPFSNQVLYLRKVLDLVVWRRSCEWWTLCAWESHKLGCPRLRLSRTRFIRF